MRAKSDHSPDLDTESGEILLVVKPSGWTSFDVVARIRSIYKVRRVGHAGTLDPLASGLLIIGTGKRTKNLDQFQSLEKEYEGEMKLGESTASYDSETPVTRRRALDGISPDRIVEVMQGFVGSQSQVPPMYSAAKVDGRRLYKSARKGREVDRQPRTVLVHSLTPLAINIPLVRFKVVCSKGTYVRSLVNDMGEKLGCGAHLTALTRTRIGDFRLADAVTLQQLVELRQAFRGARV